MIPYIYNQKISFPYPPQVQLGPNLVTLLFLQSLKSIFFLRVTTRIQRDCIAQYVVGHLRTVAEARSVSYLSHRVETILEVGIELHGGTFCLNHI